MKELSAQRNLIKRLIGLGGYGKKWSSTYSVGVPDLILTANHRVVFAEVKMVEPASLSKFKRKVGLSPLQSVELLRIRATGARAVVVVVISGKRLAVLDELPTDPRVPVFVTDETPTVPWSDTGAIFKSIFGVPVNV